MACIRLVILCHLYITSMQCEGHAMRAGVHSDEGIVTLQVDLTNAFNTFSREEMLSLIHI